MNNDKIIWDYLKTQGLTDAGVAGVMGNLYAESGLNPINLQDSYNEKLGYSNEEYTKAVDKGTYKNFIKDGAGYGLAQWTFWSRKQDLLKLAQSRRVSVGSLTLQLDFLMIELNQSYKKLLQNLKTTQSVNDAAIRVLLDFERPADQSRALQEKRASYAQKYFNNYATGSKSNDRMKYSLNNKPLVCMQTNSTCYKSTRPMEIIGILWHSTGVNNPTLKRYVQPMESDPNYVKMVNIIGKNNNHNDYNHASYQSGLNAWIGKLANGTVATVQTMPWNYRPWGCGSGRKGSCNNGWIQFEICEDNLSDPKYFNTVYEEACQLTAYLCKLYNINPRGEVISQGIRVPTILCHSDSYKLGLGSNHGDIYHWFTRYGKSMETVKEDVCNILDNKDSILPEIPSVPDYKPTVPEKEKEEMTQEKFNEMMEIWLAEQAKKEPSPQTAESREWAEKTGLIQGNIQGQKMYKKPLTREEFVVVLHRALHRYFM